MLRRAQATLLCSAARTASVRCGAPLLASGGQHHHHLQLSSSSSAVSSSRVGSSHLFMKPLAEVSCGGGEVHAGTDHHAVAVVGPFMATAILLAPRGKAPPPPRGRKATAVAAQHRKKSSSSRLSGSSKKGNGKPKGKSKPKAATKKPSSGSSAVHRRGSSNSTKTRKVKRVGAGTAAAEITAPHSVLPAAEALQSTATTAVEEVELDPVAEGTQGDSTATTVDEKKKRKRAPPPTGLVAASVSAGRDGADVAEAGTRHAIRNLMRHHFASGKHQRIRTPQTQPLCQSNPLLYARLQRQKEKEENARRLSAMTVSGATPAMLQTFRDNAALGAEGNDAILGIARAAPGPSRNAVTAENEILPEGSGITTTPPGSSSETASHHSMGRYDGDEDEYDPARRQEERLFNRVSPLQQVAEEDEDGSSGGSSLQEDARDNEEMPTSQDR